MTCNHDVADTPEEVEVMELWNCNHCGTTKSIVLLPTDPPSDWDDDEPTTPWRKP